MSSFNTQTRPNLDAPLMPEDVLDRAIQLFKIPSTMYNEKSMTLYIIQELKNLGIGYKIDNYGNVLIEKGVGIKPCFCAHLDTVHLYDNGFNVEVEKKKENNKKYLIAKDDIGFRVGVGGDDKCGIFVCLELLRVIPNIKIVFFSQEESGGSGSKGVELTYFTDCMFLGGVDRWNGSDFVMTYSGDWTTSRAFRKDTKELLEQYNYKNNSGLFTDVFNVQSRGLGLSCFNMSCGYYAHHSDNEYVDTNELYFSFLLAQALCGALTKQYKFQREVKKYTKSHINTNYNWDEYRHYGTHVDNYYKSKWWEDDLERRRKKLSISTEEEQMNTKKPYIYVASYCVFCGTTLFPNEKEFCTICRRKYGGLSLEDIE